jgi:hypothetical protein
VRLEPTRPTCTSADLARLSVPVSDSTPRAGWSRFGAVALLLLLGFALVLLAIAAALYPGGSWVDRAQPGYGLWHNFVCDLARAVAINGRPNPGALWGRAGQWSLELAAGAFWLSLPALFEPPRHARAVRASGLVSTLGLLLVPLTNDVAHGVALVLGGLPGLAAIAMSVQGLRRRPTLAALGLGTFVLAAADLALYLNHRGRPVPLVITALQRLVLFLAVAWMAACALTLLRQRRFTSGDH